MAVILSPTNISRLLRPILSEHGFITIPGAGALLIWAGSAVTLGLDYSGLLPLAKLPLFDSWMPYETALAVLGTIAAAAITTLSLVYSLVLVVFTLAAGTIAPRLLQRFTNDRVSQLTAGLLGGTFLFALTVLSATSPVFVPLLSAAVVFLLAAISVLQLIYFVHAVSVNVMIDQEIAAISLDLENKMADMVGTDEAAENASLPMPEEFDFTLDSRESGFLSIPDVASLASFAAKEDIVIDLCAMPGDFINEGSPLARVAARQGPVAEEQRDDIGSSICSQVLLTPVREDYKDTVFSLNLLLEIALRALSPGVNDTFTAIACTNRLSEALAYPVAKGIKENIHLDQDAIPRLRIPGLTLEDLLLKSLQPIRLAAANNHLMLVNLAGLIRRLYAVARNDRARQVLIGHAYDLIATYKNTNPLDRDLEDLKAHLVHVLEAEEEEEAT